MPLRGAILVVCILLVLLQTLTYAASDIPRLDWTERSDWINVKTDVQPAAVGDGQADDTKAIQAALNSAGNGTTIYFPPGTYRLTQTVEFRGALIGALIVGHGRDTRLVWDGEDGGRMLWINGAAYTRYVGLSWDGQGKAAIGIDHASALRFETEVRHQHEAFRNFTGYGIRIGHEQKIATAEVLYLNCLFENCGTGMASLAFNDYNNTFVGCEFRDCGTGVHDVHGNFYVRDCHFERSRETDCFIRSEHGDSIRRCTSVGSRRFITEGGTIAPLVIQDCHVAGWTDPQGAVHLNGAPVVMFDCVFTDPPSEGPPVRLVRGGQKLIASSNRSEGTSGLIVSPHTGTVVSVPPGKLAGVVRDASQTFLRSEADVPTKVFDAKQDFGAIGDGKADDTDAIQATIDAAREHGKGALAYLPTGIYKVTRTLQVTGADYTVGGSGFRCGLIWRGEPGGNTLAVTDPQNLRLEWLAVGHHDLGAMDCEADIHQTSTGGPSLMTYDGVFAHGMYVKHPGRQGILFDKLSPESVVHAIHVQGNLRFRNCARATVLIANSYEGTISVEGDQQQRDGFLGFMMRLATLSDPTVDIRDNHSLVMSDFYNEQSDRHLVLEGNAGDPPGRVTIQGAKMHLNTQEPMLEARDYEGQVFLSSNQFYIKPEKPRFVVTGSRPLTLIIAGHFVYNAVPEFSLQPSTTLVLLENQNLANAGTEDENVLPAVSAALDDLRRLGQLDHELNGWK